MKPITSLDEIEFLANACGDSAADKHLYERASSAGDFSPKVNKESPCIPFSRFSLAAPRRYF